jgi:glyoxylase-like metal-dependent hydrolase (beta-lactamase superfamily II)
MPKPVELAPGIWRIPTLGANLVNVFAFEEPDGRLTLLDAGYKGSGARGTMAGLAALGKRPDQVRQLLLSHAHADHAGGAARVVRDTGAPVAAHEASADDLRRGRTPDLDRRSLMGRLLNPVRPKLEPVEVRSTFTEGELLDVAGGLRVLHTPGHTPGHCSFLHEGSGVLVTGDALFNFLDRMSYSFAMFCTDIPLSRQTAERLGEVDYEVVAFMHGPEIRTGARERVREFLRKHTKR